MGDGVGRTDRWAVALIGPAAVSDDLVAAGLAHGPSAVAALQIPGEGADVLVKGQLPGVLLEQGLHPVPLLPGDDGLVGAGHQHPLALVQRFGRAVHPRPGGAALLHGPHIHGVPEHPVDGGVGPVGGAADPLAVAVVVAVKPLVLAGAGDALGVEGFGDADLAHAGLEEVEDPADHLGGHGVDFQLVVVVGGFAVAVGGEGPDKLALLLLGPDRAPDLLGDVPGVLLVEHVLEGEQQVVGALGAVDVVADGDEPDPVVREPALQVVAGVDVVPAEPGQVLHQDAVDAAGLNIPDHPLEAGAVKVGAGAAVVHVDPGAGQGGVPGDVLLQDGLLGGDAVALPLVAVLPGETGVEGGPPNAAGGNGGCLSSAHGRPPPLLGRFTGCVRQPACESRRRLGGCRQSGAGCGTAGGRASGKGVCNRTWKEPPFLVQDIHGGEK